MSAVTWEPGVPLYERPWLGWLVGDQMVRPLCEVLDDLQDARWDMAESTHHQCRDCEVGWDAGDTCWVCGRRA